MQIVVHVEKSIPQEERPFKSFGGNLNARPCVIFEETR